MSSPGEACYAQSFGSCGNRILHCVTARGYVDVTRSDNQFPYHSTQVSRPAYYYLNLAPPADSELCVVSGGREVCDPDYLVRRDEFHTHTVEYVAAGRGSVRIVGKEYDLSAGALFSYGRGVAHEIRCDPAAAMTKYFVNFVGHTADSLLKSGPLGGGSVVRVSEPHEILLLFERLQHEGMNQALHAGELCALYVEILLLKTKELEIKHTNETSKAWGTFVRCKHFIDSDPERVGSIGSVAERMGIDRSYLSRLFRRYLKISAHDYIMRKRLARAAYLLITSDLSVGEVAARLEFADPFHLSRAFKKAYGISPSHFRRQKEQKS